MTQTPAGWYRDPSGLPDAYRWWDGSQWTTGLTTNPQAPAPTSAAPVRPPAQPAQDEQPTQQQPAQVPPPPGAPGPGYVPPPPWAVQQRGPLPDVVEVAPNAASNKRKALIAAIAVVCVALLGAGGYFILTNSGERTPAAAPSPPPAGEQSPDSDPPPQGEPDPSDPSDQPTIEPPDQGQPEPDPTEQAPDQPSVTYTKPAGKWFENPVAAEALPFGTAQNLVTEDDYRGEQDWVALISAGYSQPGWYDDDDLAGTAKRIAAWFADTNFGEFPVTRKQISAKAVKVDGHDAYELKERFSYTIENLKAKSEDVTIVVVDLGLTEAGGVFLASLPDTHPAEAATVTKARNSLRVVE